MGRQFVSGNSLDQDFERNASMAWAIRMPMLKRIRAPARAEYICRLHRSLPHLNRASAYTVKVIPERETGSQPD